MGWYRNRMHPGVFGYNDHEKSRLSLRWFMRFDYGINHIALLLREAVLAGWGSTCHVEGPR
jgi:hypothetical protein